MNVYVEVAMPADASTTAKGRVLERLARRLLETQNFTVTDEVRLTGMEVDLIALNNSSSERVFVECKAHRSTISAEVILKLFGQVMMRGYSGGWLISTYALGKDAKGLKEEWSLKSPDERRLLTIFEPNSLVDRLVSARLIYDHNLISPIEGALYADEIYLILTEGAEYWAKIILDQSTRLRRSVHLYDASTGARVNERGIIERISATDTTLSELTWDVDDRESEVRDAKRIKNELQSIVPVQVADYWSDYRPARPADFVGREQLQKDVLALLDSARENDGGARLFAIKAPSGWGKSSFVLKIASRANATARGKRYFVYAVDSRAASSRRFGELSIYSALSHAMDCGFIRKRQDFSVGSASDILSTATMKEILVELRSSKQVICVVFDQFEELLYKQELAGLFDEIQALCDAVIEAKANIVIGFSWKTDGTIPPEHNAYHLWHGLADRRREFELGPLTDNEVSSAINRFAHELGQPVLPQIRRMLHDHSSGYPWLLKKLCIHIFEQIRSGLDQADVVVRTLKIEELFSKDIERLSAPEYACIKQIASESPADFFKIASIYGDATVNTLLNKRIVIRSGPRLSLYWDIFRDYLLTEKVPYIPTTYIPQANIGTYIDALKYIHARGVSTYDELAGELGVSGGTADNIVRDLVMVGHVEANRKAGTVTCVSTDEAWLLSTLLSFCQSHVIYRALLEQNGYGEFIDDDEILSVAKGELSRLKLSVNLYNHYSRRMMSWFIATRLARRSGPFYELIQPVTSSGTLSDLSRASRSGQFVGVAPPEKALAALRFAVSNAASKADIESAFGRNAFYVLSNLGLVDIQGRPTFKAPVDPEELLREVSRDTVHFAIAEEVLSESPNASGEAVGEAIALELGSRWSLGSKRRIGSALKRWVKWARQQ
ncbi:MAG: restriction endonuclease [Brevundimonas sp.]|uniref:restriction endonuclease n=1 Tax=Brevundimonas sp. TaxID=1871086 RepID=UPI00273292B2|nr:restriction endonuclease [Brevundimonas sp.]MDP3404902.1 restriction endonuclease [Brevundimonas sp.]